MLPPPYDISLEQRQLHCFKGDALKQYRFLLVLKYFSLAYPGLKNQADFEFNPNDNQVQMSKQFYKSE